MLGLNLKLDSKGNKDLREVRNYKKVVGKPTRRLMELGYGLE